MGHTPVAVAAIVHSNNNRSKLPELSMSFSSDSNKRHRRSSSISQYFDVSETGEEEDSPPLSAFDSTTALILVHDDEEEEGSPLPFTDDEDERENDDELVSPMFELRRSAVFPPLQPSLVFLYLLASHLRLGALNIPYTRLPLKYALPALLLSALATAFTRQIWYMLARYIRKASVTDVFMDTFARGRGKERRRLAIRAVVKTSIGSLGILLSIVYLRYSMYTLCPVFAQHDHPILFYFFSALLVFVVVAYLSYARSLSNRRIIYATGLSLASYVAWLGCMIYAYSQGVLYSKGAWLGSGGIWPGVATIIFAFCASSTLPLYSSLKSASHPTSGLKLPMSRSFRFLSSSSALLAVLLLLPSIIFAAFPNHPAPSSNLIQEPLNSTHHSNIRDFSDLNATAVPILDRHRPLPPEIPLPAIQMSTIIRILSATTLILSIPSILVSIPPLRIPSLRSVKFNISRVIVILFVVVCGLIPPSRFPQPDDPTKSRNDEDFFLNSSGIFCFVTFLTLFMAYMGTYFIPTFLHVSQHFFKRPLAIVVPRTQPSQTSPQADESGNAHAGPSTSYRSLSSPRIHDELLLRKERALQKKQLKKRVAWDIGVWMLLFTSLAGLIGYGGYLGSSW